MITVIILLAASENLSHNIFNVKSYIVSFLRLRGDNENITGKETTLYFGFMVGVILFEDLLQPKTFGGPTFSLTYQESKKKCFIKLFLMQTGFLPKSS